MQPMQPMHMLATAEFAKIAKGFCDWCEGTHRPPLLHKAASSWLAKLHAAALELPEAVPENENGLPPLPEAAVTQALQNLASFKGLYYREYFDPSPLLDVESVVGDVGDDIADTYRDVRAGLVLYDSGQAIEALWHWAFLHRVHWGRHAVGAMFALQCVRSLGDG